MLRPLLLIAGTLCVILGIVGIALPLLPTTPFLLLAATCYSKSSDKFYQWLLNDKWLGGYIRRFRSKQGVTVRVKFKAIAVMWLTMGGSAYFVRERPYVLAVLLVCGVGVSLFVLSLPTEKKE